MLVCPVDLPISLWTGGNKTGVRQVLVGSLEDLLHLSIYSCLTCYMKNFFYVYI